MVLFIILILWWVSTKRISNEIIYIYIHWLVDCYNIEKLNILFASVFIYV